MYVMCTLTQISRKDADQFEPGQWIPECQLIVEWEKEDQRPVRLRHKVDLIGAKAPRDFFHLILNPTMEGTYCYIVCVSGHRTIRYKSCTFYYYHGTRCRDGVGVS